MIAFEGASLVELPVLVEAVAHLQARHEGIRRADLREISRLRRHQSLMVASEYRIERWCLNRIAAKGVERPYNGPRSVIEQGLVDCTANLIVLRESSIPRRRAQVLDRHLFTVVPRHLREIGNALSMARK